MLNSDLDRLIIQLNKIKKNLEKLSTVTPELVSAKPYEFEEYNSEIKKQLTLPPLSETLKESSLYKELIGFCTTEKEKVDKHKEEFHFNFGTQLKEAFLGFGELKGQLPVLRTKFYTMRFDFNNAEAAVWWGPEKELIEKVFLNLDKIVGLIKSFDQNLSVKWNNYEDFKNLLKSTYERNCKLNNLQYGEKVNLLDLLTECVILMQTKSFKIDPTKTHFTEYSRIQFSFDIYQMKKESALMSNIQLSVATFAITENKEKSLWVPDNDVGDGTYYQTIAFR